jgi:hypothetical protein
VRSFKVCHKDDTVSLIRANDFRRPEESTSGKWEFIDAAGAVLWSYSDVEAVIEGITLMEAARGQY